MMTFHSIAPIGRQPLLDLDGALEHLEIAEEMARLQGLSIAVGLGLSRRASVLAARGEPAESEQAAAQSTALLEGRGSTMPIVSSQARNVACRFAHDPERLIDAMLAVAGPHLERITPSSRSQPLLALTRAAIATGRIGDARRWAEQLAAVGGTRHHLPATAARAVRARAMVLLADGHAAEAAQLAMQAAAGAAGHRLPEEELALRLLAGRALVAAGDRDAGVAELQWAADTAARAGAGADRDAAARELRRAGTRIGAEARRAGDARAGGADGLTGRERDVAGLVARGRTNREVAEALFLSEKTVENHLSRIYAKLGLRSRSELAAIMD
jgi:DNA-binding NarL/FixJ family response regulator